MLGFTCERMRMEGNLQNTALSWTQNWVHLQKLSPAVLTAAVGRCHYPYFTAEEIEAQRSQVLCHTHCHRLGFLGSIVRDENLPVGFY